MSALLFQNGRPASPAVDDWEIDITQLQIDAKVASGAFSNLYRGSYCGQEVAVKILKDVQDDTSQYQEFLQVCCKNVAFLPKDFNPLSILICNAGGFNNA